MNELSAPLLFQRAGQPLVLVVHAKNASEVGWCGDLACSDFGICLIEAPDELTMLDQKTLMRLSAVLLTSSTSLKECRRWFDLLKAHPSLEDAPIMVQSGTSLMDHENVLIELGARSIFSENISVGNMRMLLSGALEEFARVNFLNRELANRTSAVGNIYAGEFRIKHRHEASNLATMLSLTCRVPSSIALGLAELLINGVEHGIYEIGGDLKERLIEEGKFVEELERRANDPQYQGREVTLIFEREGPQRRFLIKDPGKGFDHERVIEHFRADSMRKSGRGVVMARECFDQLIYKGNGNTVEALYICTEGNG